MKLQSIAALALLALALGAQAQNTKKDLAAKVVQLQQPGVEGLARQLVEQPLQQLVTQLRPALQRVPAEKREAVGKDIEADLRKYAEDLLPTARKRALELAPATMTPLFEEKFSEDELRQLLTILESPVIRKYQALGPEIQKTMGEKLLAELRPSMETKMRALQQSIGQRLGLPPAASAPPAGSGPAPKK